MTFGFDSTNVKPKSVRPLKDRGPSSPGKGTQGKSKDLSKKRRDRPEASSADHRGKKPKHVSDGSKGKAPVVAVPKPSLPVAPSSPRVVVTPAETGALEVVPRAAGAPAASTTPATLPSSSTAPLGESSSARRLPPEGRRGMVWRLGMDKTYPDSAGVYLPGWSRMQDPSGRPDEFGEFSREVLRAVEPPFIKKKLREDPLKATEEAMGHLFEASAIFGRLRDDLALRNGKMRVPDNVASKVTEAVLGKEQYRLEKEQVLRELEVVRKERDQARRERDEALKERDDNVQNAKDSVDLLEELGVKYEQLERDNSELSLEVATREGEIDDLKASLQKAEQDLARVRPEVIGKFLKSDGFKCAALTSLVDCLRSSIYRELSFVAEYFPFTPEQFGFGPINERDAHPKELVGYVWDEGKDQLIDPEGKVIPESLTLQTVSNPGPSYKWAKKDWPADIRCPYSPSEGDEDSSSREDSPVAEDSTDAQEVEVPPEFTTPAQETGPGFDFTAVLGDVPQAPGSSAGGAL